MVNIKKRICDFCGQSRQARSFKNSEICQYCSGEYKKTYQKYQSKYRKTYKNKNLKCKTKEAVKEYSRRYYLKNKEKIIKNCAEWRKKNPDKIKEYAARNYRKIRTAIQFAKRMGYEEGDESPSISYAVRDV